MDDIIIFGANQEDHHERLIATLKRLQQAGVTLNSEKWQFNKSSIGFLRHVIDQDGVRANPSNTSAIAKKTAPQSLTELRRFMGMSNLLGKCSSKITDIEQPLRVECLRGCSFVIETDHKPLVPLLNSKCLNMLPH